MMRPLVWGGAAIALIMPLTAAAQDWPAKQPIKIMVPFSAGSATDITARTVFEQVGKQLGQTFVIEALCDLPDATLLLVGDGPDRPRLEQLIRQRHLTGIVRLRGRKSADELAAEYRNAHVVSPSLVATVIWTGCSMPCR